MYRYCSVSPRERVNVYICIAIHWCDTSGDTLQHTFTSMKMKPNESAIQESRYTSDIYRASIPCSCIFLFTLTHAETEVRASYRDTVIQRDTAIHRYNAIHRYICITTPHASGSACGVCARRRQRTWQRKTVERKKPHVSCQKAKLTY
jgi:hypothetical protein